MRDGAAVKAAAVLLLGLCAGCGDQLTPFEPWSIVVLPDTQQYAYAHPEVWFSQADWVRDNAEILNLGLIVHVGDATETNSPAEWQTIRQGFDRIPAAYPVLIVPGNHDYDLSRERASGLSLFVTPEALESATTFGGLFDPGSPDNSYQLFRMANEDWIAIGLEWGPRDEVLAWAASVLDTYPERHAIVVTHAFTYSDNTRYDWAAHGAAQKFNPHSYVGSAWPTVNDGQEMWNKAIEGHGHVELVISGHMPDYMGGRTSTPSYSGECVHQLMVDFQDGPLGGEGYLRVLTVDSREIRVRTYSPYLDMSFTTPNHEFVVPRGPCGPDE